jgi:hypothetical protein
MGRTKTTSRRKTTIQTKVSCSSSSSASKVFDYIRSISAYIIYKLDYIILEGNKYALTLAMEIW